MPDDVNCATEQVMRTVEKLRSVFLEEPRFQELIVMQDKKARRLS